MAPVTAHLALIRRLAAHGSPGRRLHLLLSETAGLAAWLYLDLEDRANARNHYQLAVRAAERSGHPLLPAYMQASYGHFIASCGDARQGLRQIGHARERLPRSAPPVAAVWLDAIAATALAACGDRRALTVLGRAEEQIGGVTDDEPMWPWLFRFDEPKLAGYQAKAYLGLRQWQAADRAYAVASSASSAPKQRAVMDVERSQAIAGLGEIDRACTLAVTALNTGRAFGSERVVRAVADFRAALGARAGSAVDALDERLHAIYQEDW